MMLSKSYGAKSKSNYYFPSALVPTSPPQSVVVQSSTATQLDVTWDPPPLDAQNGDIQGYKVSAMCHFYVASY